MTTEKIIKNNTGNSNDSDSRTATIMFIDLVGSSEVASHRGINDYNDDYLKIFHEKMSDAITEIGFKKLNKNSS